MLPIEKLSQMKIEEILVRETPMAKVSEPVRAIIEQVKSEGDRALFEYTARFDQVELKQFEVSEEEFDFAMQEVDRELFRILDEAVDNIRFYHSQQKREGFEFRSKCGRVIGQRVIPIEKVGIYVPGGTAAYPSTVLMNAIPAQIAGCDEIVMVTPPTTSGTVNSTILVAAKLAGVNRVFKVGGAQAIAALAYGTESIPKVDKIVGPGNAYVAEAKKQVFGTVSIDMIAGPSEILIIADTTANPRFVAADMLAQAEHDKNAASIVLCTSEILAKQIQSELDKQIDQLERQEIARTSLESNGKIILCDSMAEAIDLANKIAPEHLELCVENSHLYLPDVRNAASIFLGNYTPEALGDYWAGPNHTLPTGGTARFASPLSVDDFIKTSQYSHYTKSTLSDVSHLIARFATEEGLTAHAKSILIRNEE